MTHLRAGRQRKVPLALPLHNFRVGWRAYLVDEHSNPTLIAVGRDVFHCSSVDQAMRLAVKQVPQMISAPDAQIGIRYVKEVK